MVPPTFDVSSNTPRLRFLSRSRNSAPLCAAAVVVVVVVSPPRAAALLVSSTSPLTRRAFGRADAPLSCPCPRVASIDAFADVVAFACVAFRQWSTCAATRAMCTLFPHTGHDAKRDAVDENIMLITTHACVENVLTRSSLACAQLVARRGVRCDARERRASVHIFKRARSCQSQKSRRGGGGGIDVTDICCITTSCVINYYCYWVINTW